MRRIEAFKMQCFRRLLGISWRDRITYEEVISRLGTTIKDRLLRNIKRHQAVWLGHVCRMSPIRFPKLTLFGLTSGRKCRGRPPKRWIQEVLHLTRGRSATSARKRAMESLHRRTQRPLGQGPSVNESVQLHTADDLLRATH